MAQEETLPTVPSTVTSHGDVPKKDPFSPPYIEALFLGHLTQEEDTEEEFVALVRAVYILIPVSRNNFLLFQLNKYSVVRNHFLLVTKGKDG